MDISEVTLRFGAGVVILGDSTFVNDGDNNNNFYSTKATPVIFAGMSGGRVRLLYNAAVAGYKADDILKLVQRQAVSRRPYAAILTAGINDILNGVALETYLATQLRIVRMLRAAGIAVLWSNITPVAGYLATVQTWNAAIKAAVVALNDSRVVLADSWSVVADPGTLDWAVAGDAVEAPGSKVHQSYQGGKKIAAAWLADPAIMGLFPAAVLAYEPQTVSETGNLVQNGLLTSLNGSSPFLPNADFAASHPTRGGAAYSNAARADGLGNEETMSMNIGDAAAQMGMGASGAYINVSSLRGRKALLTAKVTTVGIKAAGLTVTGRWDFYNATTSGQISVPGQRFDIKEDVTDFSLPAEVIVPPDATGATFTLSCSTAASAPSNAQVKMSCVGVYDLSGSPRDRTRPGLRSRKVAAAFTIPSSAAPPTAPTDEVIYADATGAAFTVTLPGASESVGCPITIKKTDASANAVTVSRAGSATIEGATTYGLVTQYKSVTVISDGANWFVTAAT